MLGDRIGAAKDRPTTLVRRSLVARREHGNTQ